MAVPGLGSQAVNASFSLHLPMAVPSLGPRAVNASFSLHLPMAVPGLLANRPFVTSDLEVVYRAPRFAFAPLLVLIVLPKKSLMLVRGRYFDFL